MGDLYEVDSGRIRESYRRATPGRTINLNRQRGIGRRKNSILVLQGYESDKGRCITNSKEGCFRPQYFETKWGIRFSSITKAPGIHSKTMGGTVCRGRGEQ